MSNHETIEERLKRALSESKLTRYQIAKISGLSQAQLSYFINGKRTLTLPAAAQLAEALNLELKPMKRKK